MESFSNNMLKSLLFTHDDILSEKRIGHIILKYWNWQMLDITSHEIGMVATFLKQIHGSVGRQLSDNCR